MRLLPVAFAAVLPLLLQNIPQQPQPIPTQAAEQTRVPVLHAYANIVQIPVLVLTPTQNKVDTSIASDRFSISLDRGPWFKASNARLEGDDPIELSIVIDARKPQAKLLVDIDDAIAGLAPSLLHPQDHISIYVMSCAQVHTATKIPANPAQLKAAVDSALGDWVTSTKDKSTCSKKAPIWDLLTFATNNLAPATGRRVIFAVTNGEDSDSTHPWDELAAFAQRSGVAIFGLNPDPDPGHSALRTSVAPPGANFSTLCELTGGLVLRTSNLTGSAPLNRVTQMVRERYILDLPRPTDARAAIRNLQVRIDHGNYFIRPAGNSVPLASPGQQ